MMKDVWCSISLSNEVSSFTKLTVLTKMVCTEGWVQNSSLSTTKAVLHQSPFAETGGQRYDQGSQDISALQATIDRY